MNNFRNIAFWLILFFLLVALFNVFSGNTINNKRELSFSQFLDQVGAGKVSEVVLDGETIHVREAGGTRYEVVQPLGTNLVEVLSRSDVEVRAVKQEKSGLMSAISVWLPFILLIGVWLYLMNRMQGGGRGGADGNVLPQHLEAQSKPPLMLVERMHVRTVDLDLPNDECVPRLERHAAILP